MIVSAIVAASENNCIGKDNKMPWHIPDDLKRFKAVTAGKPVVMGRKTFESILGYLGKPLPGRTSIIISRSGYEYDGVLSCPDIESAIEAAKKAAAEHGLDEIIIGGGAQIYDLALPYTNRIYLTKVHKHVEGDAFFPSLDDGEWKISESEDREGDPSYTFLTLDKT